MAMRGHDMGNRLMRIIMALAAAGIALFAAAPASAQTPRNQARIADLTIRQGEIPRRIVGYGLVVGLDGTGDRSFGGNSDGSPTVRSVVNLLRRFDVMVPSERLRLRNVAAVLVTAEVSPFLRAGGRFDVSVSALGDATSLHSGTLWITPLLTDPGTPPIATAQGAIRIADDNGRSLYGRRGNSGTITQGGILEVDPPPTGSGATPRLLLKDPNLGIASRIAATINSSVAQGTATVEDPGSISVTPKDPSGNTLAFMAGIDTLTVRFQAPARIVISEREGTVVAGGDVRVGTAVVHHKGITLQIGGEPKKATPPKEGETPAATPPSGFLQMPPEASVQDVAAGLSTAGATPDETVAIFEALCAAGALNAEVVVR
jgi:flagellar P-ring protein precursor FlgI